MTEWTVLVIDEYDEAICGKVSFSDRGSAIEAMKVLCEYENIEDSDRFIELRCHDEQ